MEIILIELIIFLNFYFYFFYNRTTLFYASKINNKKNIEFLIENGVNIHHINEKIFFF